MLLLVILFAMNHLAVYISIFIFQIYKFKYLRIHTVANRVSPCWYYWIIWKTTLLFQDTDQWKAMSLKKKLCLAWTGLFVCIISRQIETLEIMKHYHENIWNNAIVPYSLSSILSGTIFFSKSPAVFYI